MSNYKINNEAIPPKKEKKRMGWFGKVLISFLITVVGIPLLLVGVVFACFYDNGHTAIPLRENYTNEMIVEDVVTNSLDTTVSEEKISLAIKENQLNQILYNAISGNEELSKYIKNMYVNVNDGTTTFVLEADLLNFFKSRIFLTTKLEYNAEEDAIKLQITDIKLGRVGGMQKALDLITKVAPLPDISSALQSSGLSINFDLNKLLITYKVEDFYNDLTTLVGISNTNTLFTIVNEIFSKKDLREIGATGKTVFGFNILVNKLKTTQTTLGIEGYNLPSGYYDSELTSIKTTLKSFLDTGKIEKKDSDVVAKYIMSKDLFLTSGEKTIIDNYASNHVFDGITTYESSYSVRSEDELRNIIINQIPAMPINPFDIVINTAQIDKMLKASPDLGVMNTFVTNEGSEEEKNYKVNYITTDRLTTVIKDNNVFFTVNLNLNGYTGNLTLKCPQIPSTQFGKYNYSIGKMYLGDYEVSDTTKNTFTDIFISALHGDAFGSVVTANKAEQKITIDFTSILDSRLINETNFDLEFAMNDTSSTENGKLVLHVTPKI